MLEFYLSLIDDQSYSNRLLKIYNEYKDWMLTVAFHFLKNEENAKDAVHNVFVNIAKKIRDVPEDTPDNIKSYLYISVKNASFTMLKKNKKHSTFNLDDQFSIANELNVEKEVADKVLYEQVLKYIDELPTIYKEALTLHIVHNKSYDEMAVILNVPYKTAHTRYLRARDIVRKRFGDLI